MERPKITKATLKARIRDCKAARREQWPQRRDSEIHPCCGVPQRDWHKNHVQTHKWAGKELKELAGRLRRLKASEQQYLWGVSDALTFVELEYGTGAYA